MDAPETRSRRQHRRERELANRRVDAIEGAAAVFAAKGFHEAQMTEIAAAAELSLASLYAMFRGKEELYADVVRTATDRMRSYVQRAVESIDDPAEALLALIEALFECFEDSHDLTRMFLAGTQGGPWRVRGEPARDPGGGFLGWIAGLSREAKEAGYLEGLDPGIFATVLIGSVAAVATASARDDPTRPFTEMAPSVRAVFARLLHPARA